MKKKEEQEIAKIYDDRVEKDGKSILDVGCGFGDLYDYLGKKGVKLKSYEGIDISPKIVEKAKTLHAKDKNAAFRHGSLKELEKKYSEEEFDYVVESGIFNYNLSDNYKYLAETLELMFRLCRAGVSINMTTDYVDYKEDCLFYFNPEKVFGMCKKLTKRVCLRHDYMPFEFTVYLYKNQEKDEHNVFKGFSDRTLKKRMR